ncbi:MAG: redoxin domain-containing protein [Chloroflexota bacterium]
MTEQTEPLVAPDFTLPDTNDNPVRLSDYRGQRHVVLALTRGVF